MKLAKFFTLIFSSSCLIASSPCDYYHPFAGFYAGASGGITTQMADSKFDALITVLVAGTTETNELIEKSKNYRIKPWGEVFAGWGLQCGNIYLGGRLGVNFSSFDINHKYEEIATTITPGVFEAVQTENLNTRTKLSTAEFTFDFKPGWVFCQRTLFFGLLGGAVNKERFKGSFTDSLSEVGLPPFASLISVNKRRTSVAFRGGFGVEHMITRCLSLQVAYTFTQYSIGE